jgi:hypothetical protein
VAEHLEQVVNTDGFRILGSSIEQYELLPKFRALLAFSAPLSIAESRRR